MKIKIITHFANDDKDFYCDYYAIEVKDMQGNLLYSKGDDYHDKGAEKVEGFIAGLNYILGENVEIEKINIADGDDFI